MNFNSSFISNKFFLYKKEEKIYIGFGEKADSISNSSFFKKLGWDAGVKDWIVKNGEMESIQCQFIKCEWKEIRDGEIGFYYDESNDFYAQQEHLDNYLIKCNNLWLVHIIDINSWNSVIKCKAEDKYCFYKLIHKENTYTYKLE